MHNRSTLIKNLDLGYLGLPLAHFVYTLSASVADFWWDDPKYYIQ